MHLSLSFSVPLCLPSFLFGTSLTEERSESQRRQEVCCCEVSVSGSFWFSLSSVFALFLCFLCAYVSWFDVLKLRWNCSLHCCGFCLCPTVVLIPHDVSSTLSYLSLLSFLLSLSLFYCSSYSCHCLSPFHASQSDLSCFAVSVLWSFQLFSVPRLKDHLSAVCCLHSESFSSGSLPHAATLTAGVKRSDLLRITNVLWGNELNYAHQRGKDTHNTGFKLLKVTQYLALQLPAVYRKKMRHVSPHWCARVPLLCWPRHWLSAIITAVIQDDGLMTAE